MADRVIEFLLTARDQASAVFGKVGDAAERGGKRAQVLGTALGTVAGGAVLGGISALGGVITDAFAGAQEAAAGVRVLESQIRNLSPAGQAAFSTATQFADEFGASIGRDNDDIIAVQTKLSTFPNAFAQGSLGAEAMRRATQAAFDLEASGIGAAESNIIGIGKALDNPIKGMTALSKAGVSFSDAQKKAIEQAVAQGDLAKAQSIILQGIESNAKGAAEAAVSNIDKLKTKAADFAEGLAGAALPAIDNLAGKLLTLGDSPVFTKLKDGFSGLLAFIVEGDFTGAFSRAFGLEEDSGTVARLFELRDAVVETFGRVKQIITDAVDAAGPKLREIGDVIKNDVAPAFSAFIDAAQPIVDFLLDKLGPVVSQTFSSALAVIKGAFQIIAGLFNVLAGLLTGDWSRMWDGIKQATSGAWNVIKAVFQAAVTALGAIFTTAIATLRGIATRIMDAVKSAFGSAKSLLSDAGRKIIDGLVDGINAGFQRVRNVLSSLTNLLPSWKGPARRDANILYAAGRLVMGGFQRGLEDGYGGVRGSLGDLTSSLGPALPAVASGRSGGAGITVVVNAGAVGNEDHLARTIQDALARTQLRGYGYAGAYGA